MKEWHKTLSAISVCVSMVSGIVAMFFIPFIYPLILVGGSTFMGYLFYRYARGRAGEENAWLMAGPVFMGIGISNILICAFMVGMSL